MGPSLRREEKEKRTSQNVTPPCIEIKNRHRYQGDGYYIGRPSPLGNPFEIGRDGGRDEVIERYQVWLLERLGYSNPSSQMFVELFDELCDKNVLILTCWCKPKRCHGEVIRDFLLQAWKEKHGEVLENKTLVVII